MLFDNLEVEQAYFKVWRFPYFKICFSTHDLKIKT